jgi:MFS transporter, PAT family, beta-lactamase induction signal transducer AmpG
MRSPGERRSPVTWIVTSYFAEGLPFAIVIWVAGTMFKDLGHDDGEITLATASIGIAWSLKPLWAAFLDMYRTKKFFVLAMEVVLSLVLVAIAFALPMPNYFQIVIALLWILAFASATQDICVDGVYITSLDEKLQAKYIGVQGMAWNTGRLFATAVVVAVAGTLKQEAGQDARTAWMWALGLAAVTMAGLAVFHRRALPVGAIAERPRNAAEVLATFWLTLQAFFAKKSIWGMLAFVFLYRSSEGLLLVEAPLFLQAAPEAGGVGLSLTEKGFIDGTVATVAGIAGGLCGGAFIARYGLRPTLVFLALCLNVPHLTYVYLSQIAGPGVEVPFTTVAAMAGIEKFGYSFGFVGNMLYMMQQIAPGKYKMAHYAFATALMNLVLVPTQMLSGPLADWLGYRTYFVVVMFAMIPSVLAAWLAPFPNPADGRDSDAA